MYDSVLIWEHMCQRKPVFWHTLRSVTYFVLNKVPTELTVKNFRCLKALLMDAFQTSIAKNFYVVSYWNLFLCGVVSLFCISHASGKVLQTVVKFYQEIFYESSFSNTWRQLLLKLPRNHVAEHHWISFYGIFANFSCLLVLSSVLIFSILFSPHFCKNEVKIFFSIS